MHPTGLKKLQTKTKKGVEQMIEPTFKMTGLKELEDSLRELTKEFGGKAAPQALRPAVKAAIAPLEGKLSQATPVDSGDLQDSVKMKIGKPSKKLVSYSQHYSDSTILYGAVGWYWRNPSLWHQALAVEFGTANNPAQFILRSLLDGEEQAMISRFQKTLGPSIEKKAKQLHNKRMKGK